MGSQPVCGQWTERGLSGRRQVSGLWTDFSGLNEAGGLGTVERY